MGPSGAPKALLVYGFDASTTPKLTKTYKNKAFGALKAPNLTILVLFSIVFGIIIEVLQGSLTATRDSDIQDVFANTLGAVVASLIIGIKNKYVLK